MREIAVILLRPSFELLEPHSSELFTLESND